MELLKTLFENAELPADFKVKTTALFEAAVDEKVKADLASIQETYDAKLVTAKETLVSESVALIDSVVEETILEWAKENAVGLDSQLKGQIAESFLSNLKAVFEKADIELSGDTAGKELVKLQEQNIALVTAAAESKAALIEAEDKLIDLKVKEIIESVTAGLADTQAHRVAKLCEAFDFKGEVDFRAKAAMVLEAVVGIKGTVDVDGAIVAVTGGATKSGNVVDTSAGAAGSTDGKLVADIPVGTRLPDAPAAPAAVVKHIDPLKEAYDKLQAEHAPHLHSDMIAETLKLFKR
jgi:hypothetical protein